MRWLLRRLCCGLPPGAPTGGHSRPATVRQSPVPWLDWEAVGCSVAKARVRPASTGTSLSLGWRRALGGGPAGRPDGPHGRLAPLAGLTGQPAGQATH